MRIEPRGLAGEQTPRHGDSLSAGGRTTTAASMTATMPHGGEVLSMPRKGDCNHPSASDDAASKGQSGKRTVR